MTTITDHRLLYRAGSSGLEYAGIPNCSTPHWYCSCGAWRINRNPRSGSPHRETATKHHRRHLASVAVRETGERTEHD